jgi:hypothetical protein
LLPENHYENDYIGSLPPSIMLRKNLNLLLEAASVSDLETVEKVLSKIELLVLKIYSAEGRDWSEIKEILRKMRYANNHFTIDRWRLNRMQKLYAQLTNAFNKDNNINTFRQILEKLGSEIYEIYHVSINHGNPEYLDELRDFNRKLFSFDIRVKNEEPKLYERYKKSLKSYSKFLAKIVILQPIEKNGRFIFHKDSVKVVSNEFSKFYQDFTDFLAGFEEPDEKKR